MVGRSPSASVTRLAVGFAVMTCLCIATAQPAKQTPSNAGILYRNPGVYNVDYSFEMTPDPNTIDRAKDLKVWVPVPREWDSQKAVKIISVQPEPHARYVDPEYGNSMLFYDFGKEPEQATYKVDIKFRLESYEVSVQVDPNRVGSYEKTSKDYALYTQSTRTIHITPKIKELAQEAVGDETNPYLQAERIVKFVYKKMHFKVLDYERGRGIDCLLAYPVTDEETGLEYYEGCCNQYAALTVALCRAVGMPARCVSGYVGWYPWIKPDEVKAKYLFETKLSPEGLTATQHYGEVIPHMWNEFFIPDYGWIPADALRGRIKIGHQNNRVWIKTKGRDFLLGPGAPPEDAEGYGAQWVALHDGRADCFFHAVLNIAKIRDSKVTVVHHSDPFPADGLAGYPENPPTSEDTDRDLRHWRQGVLSWPSSCIRSFVPENLNLDQFYKDYPRARDGREAFVCHMLHRQLGDEVFFKLVKAYVDLRQKSGQAVPTSRFQELAEDIYGKPLGWFFNQWVNSTDLPRLRLENVTVRKDSEGWQIKGSLMQSGDKTFRLPIEIALDTEKGRDEQKLWVEKKATDFQFRTRHEPRTLVVDPDYEVLKVQKMPPRLWWFDDLDPIVIYGTLGEAQANESIANHFVRDELGYGREIIKADADVNDADLKTKCVFLIGRPETNRIAQQFKDSFPIKFDGARFTWQGMTYDRPTQRLHQIIENPNYVQGLMIMYAGLSPEATLKMRDLESYDSDGSYVIFDGDKQLAIGDWEDMDADLYWSADPHPSPGLTSSPAQ
jgi:transglutaminase-like putative cysteine protease